MRHHPLIVAALAATLATTLLSSPADVPAAPTEATNPAIEKKRAEAERVRETLEDMGAALEAQVEEYNGIDEALRATRERSRKTRAQRTQAAEDLLRSQELLGERAAGIYKSGSVPFVDVLFGTTSFADFLTRLEILARVGRRDAALVSSVRDAERRLQDLERELAARDSEQVALRDRAEIQRERIEGAMSERKAYMRALDEEVRRLVDEERQRQEELARERARKAAEAARRRAAEAATRTRSDAAAAAAANLAAGESLSGVTLAAGGGRSGVVEVALRYLGVPYVWGGSTPSGFDCSGLTQYCYREVGVELPRTSRSQYQVGARISADRLDLLVAGDLVFFGYDADPGAIHHVGIYVGGGDFIHAPQTGESVRVASLQERIDKRGDYVGGTRP